MHTSAGAWSRAARSAVFSCSAVALGVLAHVLGGAEAPSGALTVAAGAAVFTICVAASRRERMFSSLAVLMVAVQALLHLSFMLLSPAVPGSPSGTTFHGLVLDRLGCGVPMASMSLSALWPGWSMLTAHLLAAAAMAWALRCAESALWSLLRLPARIVLRLLHRVEPVRPPAALSRRQLAAACARVTRLVGCRLQHVLILRGPPLPA